MAKIYGKKYVEKIHSGMMSKDQALADVDINVPARWRAEVKEYINEHA